MTDLPQPTESHIRSRPDPGSFGRGQGRYRNGHSIAPRRQGNTLKARCIGSRPEPSTVEVTLVQKGIAHGACACPVGAGGHCKHTVALLLTWLHEPEAFTTMEDLETLNERRETSRWRWRSDRLSVDVARAAEAERPREAIDELIAARGRHNYATAATYLARVREFDRRLGEASTWQTYIAELRERNPRLRALKDELAKAGLIN